MKIKLMLDRRKFNKKPVGGEIGGVQNRIQQAEIDLKDLSLGLNNGMSCRASVLENGQKGADHWIQQQIFMLDYDHNITIQEVLQECNRLNILPCFGYTSFSHTEEEHRFRLAFVTDEVITDGDKRDKLQVTLMHLFGETDGKCLNRDRLFFGGKAKTPFYENYNTRINADEIINKYFKEEYQIKIDALSTSKKSKKQKVKKVSEKHEKVVHINDDYLQNIDAIKSLNPNKLRGLICELEQHTDRKINLLLVCPSSDVVVTSKKELYERIYSIDLHDFIGINENEFINCILPDHEDTNPSAHIYTTKDGTQVYHCFGCDTTLTIIGLVEELAQISKRKAINFIKKVYNIRLEESEWIKEHREILIENNIEYLDSEEFDIQFPNLSRLIRTRKHHIQKMMMYFSSLIDETMQLNEKPLFFLSYDKLLKVCGIRNNNRTTLSKSLILFNLLNMIDKIDPNNLPDEQLNKAKSISAKYGFKKLTNFYQFNEYGRMTLKPSEKMAKTLIENNVSIKGISREYVLRTFGTELADKVFPQYKFENHEVGTSNKSDKLTIKISKTILKVIEKQGYILESKIKINGKTETQWKKSIQEILDTYNLVRVKASKNNKEKYNIPEKISYQSYVIVKNK